MTGEPASSTSTIAAPTLFGLLRHGMTRWNEEHRIQGQADSPLSPKGKERTVLWAEALPSLQWQRIIASDLGRVRETVDIINQRLHLEVVWEKGLREQHWGLWEGMTFAEIRRCDADLLSRQQKLGWDFQAPHGESRKTVLMRAQKTLTAAATRWPGERILIISHQGVIKCLLYSLLKRSFLPDEPALPGKNNLHILACRNKDLRIEKMNIDPLTLQ